MSLCSSPTKSELFYAGARVYRRISCIKKQGLVFGIDNGTNRSFVHFDNFEDFEPWYLALDPNKRTLSEVITSNVRKLILDIDSPDSLMLEKLLMYDFERHITSRIHDVFFRLDIGTPNVIFYSMCSDNKVSYHAVVSNFMFSAHTCLGLCTIISSGQIWENCADKSVYKTTQFMRIEKSTKFGEYRWKERLTEPCAGLGQMPCRQDSKQKPGSLREGLLSDPVDTQTSSFTTLICNIARGGLGKDQKELFMLGSWNNTGYINSQFRMGKPNKNGIVPLYRTKPGFCVQCNREHNRENAFIGYYMGSPAFICWRYYHTK